MFIVKKVPLKLGNQIDDNHLDDLDNLIMQTYKDIWMIFCLWLQSPEADELSKHAKINSCGLCIPVTS